MCFDMWTQRPGGFICCLLKRIRRFTGESMQTHEKAEGHPEGWPKCLPCLLSDLGGACT